MRDNLTGIQPSERNHPDWNPAGDVGGTPAARPGISFDKNQEVGGSQQFGGNQEFGGQPNAGHEYKEKLSGAVSQAKDYLGEKASAVGGKLKEFATDDLGGMANKAKDFARQNPGQAILVAAAAGVLLGLFVRGRR